MKKTKHHLSLLIFFCVTIGTALSTHAESSAEQIAKCRAYYDEEIEEIDERMRQKYSSEQGEKMRELRRTLKSQRAKTCR